MYTSCSSPLASGSQAFKAIQPRGKCPDTKTFHPALVHPHPFDTDIASAFLIFPSSQSDIGAGVGFPAHHDRTGLDATNAPDQGPRVKGAPSLNVIARQLRGVRRSVKVNRSAPALKFDRRHLEEYTRQLSVFHLPFQKHSRLLSTSTSNCQVERPRPQTQT